MALCQEKINEALQLIQNADPTSDADVSELQTLEGLFIMILCLLPNNLAEYDRVV